MFAADRNIFGVFNYYCDLRWKFDKTRLILVVKNHHFERYLSMTVDPESAETSTNQSVDNSEKSVSIPAPLPEAIPDPPALFDAKYYCEQLARQDVSIENAWEHFYGGGFREANNPHPLFDIEFFRSNYLCDQPDVNPLMHYVRHPLNRLSTHPLLNVEHYVGQLRPQQVASKPKKLTWLEYFLANNLVDQKSACKKFSSKRYLQENPEVRKAGLNPLLHFVTQVGNNSDRAIEEVDYSEIPTLFDERYYLESNPDLDNSPLTAWQHFCDHGFREDRNPHPCFHTRYYRTRYLAETPDVNPLLHYVEQSKQVLDTHPLFDAAFYLSQVSTTMERLGAERLTPLDHFLKHNRENLASPSPLFSSRKYLDYHQDIAKCKANPLAHFIVHGQGGRRQSFVDLDNLELLRFRSEYELRLMSMFPVDHQDFITSMVNASNKQTIICVSHEASMTGAPLIILEIANKLHDKFGVDVVNILCRGGNLQPQFELLGPTINFNGNAPHHWPEKYSRSWDLFRELIKRADVLGVLVNSAESRHLLPDLKELNVPIHSLVHENARCYPEGEFSRIAEFSDRVIFPSGYVKEAAVNNTQFDEAQMDVIPQGLLNENLLELEVKRNNCPIRQELGIPKNATFVLACGTRDGRKGIDLFISTALIALSQATEGSLYFGWLGGSPHINNTEHSFWATKDLEVAGVGDGVRFLTQTDNVAPYFQAADMLFLPSRIDPFPCVVNEAMAAAKPIVLFDKGSGCVDLIKNEGGAVVPYGNVALAAEAILELSKYPSLRNQMGMRNRDYVKQHMCFDNYVESILHGLMASMLAPEYEMIESEAYQKFHSQVESTADPDHKKVIFALPAWNISGVNTFVENLIMELRENGYDASILFTTRDSGKVENQHLPKVPFRYLTSATLEPDEQRDRVAEYLKLNAPCVFVPNYDYISSSVSSSLPGEVGVLGVLHCDDDEHYIHGYQLGHYWNAMVAVSDTIKEKMLQLNPAFADRAETIRYGIPTPTKIPTRAGRSSDPIRLIYTGRMIQQQKRIFDFVELTKQLRIRQVPFELTFVGDGQDEASMKQELADLVEEGVVRFLGRQAPDQVLVELAQHDALVLTSEFEGLPLSLLEAMAHGCVAVVTDIESGVSEILEHGQNAMLSPVGEMDAMAANIEALQRDRELAQSLRERGYATLNEYKLTAKQMAEQYADVLDRIFIDIKSSKKRNVIPLNCPHVGSMLNVA